MDFDNDIVKQRTQELLQCQKEMIARRTDRMFAALMVFQWLLGIVLALWLSPTTWTGTVRQIHIHVYAAVFLGGIISILPVILALAYPGRTFTRHIIAIGQMLTSALLIHLTGGRIETHFHVFGSLAFLAFYRDWRVLVTATVVVALDHILRGFFWPQSVYGIMTVQPWRFVEHAIWVFFEDSFLVYSIYQGVGEMKSLACRQAELENTNLECRKSQTELLRSNNELERFAYVTSHDLQEPLRKISIFGERLLKSQDIKSIDEANQDYLKRMMKAAYRMRELIEDLLAYSRVTKSEAPLEEISLNSIVQEVMSDLEVSIEQNQGQIDVDPLPVIRGDRIQMKQLFQNLIGNAIKFSQKGKIPHVFIKSRALKDGRIEISVQDNGIGFDEKYLDRIFEPFQRLHNRESYQGTGIGLAICKKIAQRHGGELAARSKPGSGSTFSVTLRSVQPCDWGKKDGDKVEGTVVRTEKPVNHEDFYSSTDPLALSLH